MKKVGFTLAEVLITIAIIGVIAALTLPTLQTNILRQQIPTKLAKAINSLENANQLLVQQNNIRDIFRFCGEVEYLECLVENGVLKAHQTNAPEFLRGFVRRNNIRIGFVAAYETNDNIAFYSTGNTWMDLLKPTYALNNTNIHIDINGPQRGPNVLGIDVFVLAINGSGAVFPYRGAAYSAAAAYEAAPAWLELCNENGVSDTVEGANSGEACAASIVDNGYKIIYPFTN